MVGEELRKFGQKNEIKPTPNLKKLTDFNS